MRAAAFVLLPLILLAACGGGGGSSGPSPASPAAPPAPALPQTPNPAPAIAAAFVDATSASNILYQVDITLPWNAQNTGQDEVAYISVGGGAAGDCDADGDIDLFVTYGDGGPNRLYINQLHGGSGTPLQFDDRAAAAGVAFSREDGAGNDRHSGPSFADLDGDGHLDLFIGAMFGDPVKVYRNSGNCSFVDVTATSGLDSLLTPHTINAGFGDYDLDGDLDLMLSHWGSDNNSGLPAGTTEHLFRNVSNAIDGIRFENVSVPTAVSEILIQMRELSILNDFDRVGYDYTLTPLFARINDDLWPDLAIAADFGTATLLLNDLAVSGTFANATNEAVNSIQYGMGAALGDIDFDGDLDWFVTSIFGYGMAYNKTITGNRLLRNPGGDFAGEQFENITESSGVADGRWGWAACFVDIDNDADLDIYQTNGWAYEFGSELFFDDPTRVFIADSSGIQFTDEAQNLGLADSHDARGAICADFDNDGDIDIFQLTNKPVNSGVLWGNVSAASGRNALRVRLVGLPPNTEASGARIFATIGSTTQMREIILGNNYLGQNPAVQVIGLGTASSVDSLRVEWPALLAGSPPVPTQPDEWVRGSVPASAPGQTLVICHPALISPPAECEAPD